MSAIVRFDTPSLQAVYDSMNDIEKALVDMRPAWRKLRRKWQDRATAQWTSNRWRPLDPEYAKWKARHGFSTQVLVKTGALRTALRTPATFEPERDSVVMGVRFGVGRSDAHYGYYHQQGHGVPKRTIWRPLRGPERDQWAAVVWEHVTEPIRRGG